MAAKSGLIDTWLKKHDILFVAATRHPFIHSIRDGSIDFSAFKLWLLFEGQDYLFVRAFVPFVASVLVKACKNLNEASDMEVILAGIAALNDEIAWFKKEAAKWEVDLANITPQKANQNYCRYLESLMRDEVDYPVAMTALWAVESVYHQSFAHCLEDDANAPQELQEACQRWGSDGFGRYCQSLKDIANQLLEKASDGVRQEAEVALMSVLEHEVEFWNMSHRT